MKTITHLVLGSGYGVQALLGGTRSAGFGFWLLGGLQPERFEV